MRIVATPLTSGNVTPGKEQPGTRTWRWRGKPVGWPMDPATHDKSPRDAVRESVISARQKERNDRIARYIQARDDGKDKLEAAASVGVSSNNAGRDYENAYKAALEERARAAADEEAEPGELVAELHKQIASRSPQHAALVAAFERKQRERPRLAAEEAEAS